MDVLHFLLYSAEESLGLLQDPCFRSRSTFYKIRRLHDCFSGIACSTICL